VPLLLRAAAFDKFGNPAGNPSVGLRWNYQLNFGETYGMIEPIGGPINDGFNVTLGSMIGTQTITYTRVPCLFNPSSPNQIQIAARFTATVSPATQLNNKTVTTSGATGSTITLKVQALDKHGYFVPGASLRFQVTGTDGAFSNGSTDMTVTTTDIAQANYVIGASSMQQVTVTTPNVPPLTITIQRSP
jgi:hypothetical protein